jgi:hypothetical protein
MVESKGVPTVVILPADDYQRLITEQDADARKQQQLALLDEIERFAKEVAARYPDRPSPDSVEIIRQMREERDDELLGLR